MRLTLLDSMLWLGCWSRVFLTGCVLCCRECRFRCLLFRAEEHVAAHTEELPISIPDKYCAAPAKYATQPRRHFTAIGEAEHLPGSLAE